jgi:hypothetical protein
MKHRRRFERSARAWFYGKLLLAALREARVNRPGAIFPLWGKGVVTRGGRYGMNNGLRPVTAKRMLPQAIPVAKMFENLRRLAELRANSRRRRLPALCRLLVPN